MNNDFNWDDYPDAINETKNKDVSNDFNWDDYPDANPSEVAPETASLFSKAVDSLEAGARSIGQLS